MNTDEIEVCHIPADQLIANDWNPNEMDEKKFKRLVKDVEQCFVLTPLHVVPLQCGNYRIIDGHKRKQAVEQLCIDKPKVAERFKKLPCIVLCDEKWNDEDVQKFVSVRLNVLRGKLNPEKFALLYSDLASRYEHKAIQTLMAFTDQEKFNKLVQGVQKSLKQTDLPNKLTKNINKRMSKINTVDELASYLDRVFSGFKNTLDNGFMVFSYGDKEILYVNMNKHLKDKMWAIKDICARNDVTISDALAVGIDMETILKNVDQLPKINDDEQNIAQ